MNDNNASLHPSTLVMRLCHNVGVGWVEMWGGERRELRIWGEVRAQSVMKEDCPERHWEGKT